VGVVGTADGVELLVILVRELPEGVSLLHARGHKGLDPGMESQAKLGATT
jgi:hypothetical protein